MHSHLAKAHHHFRKHGKLHVIVPIFNPLRYVSRHVLLKEFVPRAVNAGAEVWIAEAAFGHRPWMVKKVKQANKVRFRVHDELWLKEAMINATVARLPHDWQYVAWIDGDISFTNPHWVQETIEQLQHFDVVQMFGHAVDVMPNGAPGACFKGLVASVLDGDPWPRCGTRYVSKGGKFHPGFAWAARRSSWHKMGGLLDINVIGGGDHQMAWGFWGHIVDGIAAAAGIPTQMTPGYRKALLAWQNNSLRLERNIGFVPGTIMHHWHGHKRRRGYMDRWQILARNEFDPYTDLKRDCYGLWQLAGNKPRLRDDLRAYFRSRQEDSIDE